MTSPTRKQLLVYLKDSARASKQLATRIVNPTCSVEEVQQLLNRGALIEEAYTEVSEKNASYNKRKVPAINHVLEHDREDLLSVLYQAGSVDKTLRDNWMEQGIYMGATKCCLEMLRLGELDRVPEQAPQWLQAGCVKGSVEVVQALIVHGVNPDTVIRNEGGAGSTYYNENTPLFWIANKKIGEVLVKAGADINARDTRGRPALSYIIDRADIKGNEKGGATRQNLLEAAAYLIECGAELALPQTNNMREWSLLEDHERVKSGGHIIAQALAKRKDFEPTKLFGKVKSLSLAEAFIDQYPDLPAGRWLSPSVWRSYWLGSDEKKNELERVIDKGIEPPRLQDVDPSYIKDWVEFGIPINSKDIETMDKLHGDDEDPYDDWSSSSWDRPNEKMVAQSNAKALARVAKKARAQVVEPDHKKPKI